jgi:hypothetical protein
MPAVQVLFALQLNSEPVKYAIVAMAAPLWIPFARALWHTLNDGLRDEGGLLGQPPTEEQLRELEQRYGPAGASLISVPKDHHGPRMVPGRAGNPPAARPSSSARSGFR